MVIFAFNRCSYFRKLTIYNINTCFICLSYQSKIWFEIQLLAAALIRKCIICFSLVLVKLIKRHLQQLHSWQKKKLISYSSNYFWALCNQPLHKQIVPIKIFFVQIWPVLYDNGKFWTLSQVIVFQNIRHK